MQESTTTLDYAVEVDNNSDAISNDVHRARSSVCSFLYVPRNSISGQQLLSVHSNFSNDRSLQKANGKRVLKSSERPDLFARALSEKLTRPWIEQVFLKRECIKFIPSTDSDRCGCGRTANAHSAKALSRFTKVFSSCSEEKNLTSTQSTPGRWTIAEHTLASQTDAFGTLEFLGGAHAHKAHYVRLGYDSEPADIMYLMEKVWHLEPPRLVITVHGGITNFEVQDKLGRVFREGLLKAAQTTGAWIITAGIDSGVVRHVATALDEAGISARMRSKIVTIGIAPWGLLKKRDKLIGKDIVVPYDPHSFSSRSGLAILNDRHSYFLLVDNGTSGRYGADIILRKRFEEFIAQKQTLGCGTRGVPIVCAVLEGGTCTIRAVLQYLTNDPPVPVIVCDGSGRASDLLSFAHRYMQQDGTLPAEVREQLLTLIAAVFRYSTTSPEQLLDEIMRCVRHRDLLTVFRLGEKKQDVDRAILAALLKGQNFSPADQLALTLAWNRVDIARSEIFVDGHQWPVHALHSAMMEALVLNRVDFVNLLLENGVSMKKFLTITRLEQLYNMEHGPPNTIRHLIRNKLSKAEGNFGLPEIGAAVEKLMGNAYKCHYTSRQFKNKYEKYRKKAMVSRIPSFRNLRASYGRDKNKTEQSKKLRAQHSGHKERNDEEESDFKYPFNELMLWAVLTRRQAMARCMWMHGEEPMAKALVAVRLYKCMSKEAADDYLEVEISNQLRQFAEEFKAESLDLLDHCYQQDDTQTLRLLTAELPNWGHHTCLSLAVIANNKQFLAHPCQPNVKVILALAFPPSILLLEVKSPVWPARSDVGQQQHYVSSSNDSDEEVEDRCDEEEQKLGRQSSSSAVSLRITSLFKQKKRAFRKPSLFSRDADKQITDAFKAEDLMERGHSHYGSTKRSGGRMRWRSKVSAFYSAPITTFWAWSLSFASFLFAMTYVLLIEFPVKPLKVEWFLLAYVIAFAMEHFRKLVVQEASSLFEKIRVFFNRHWNYLTVLAIVSFFVGFAFRLNPTTRHSYGRVILACDSVLWYIKVLDFMSVHPRLGPYITMAGKMVLNMCYIIVLLLVTLMAFGVSRQSITYPHEKWNWLLIRNIFYKPYFMLYGEVYAGEIDTCGDEGTNCVPGGWIPPALMTVFLLVANILLINMLIAIFNNIFNETNAMSQQVWLFQRYEQVLEYENTPLIPPPFTPIAHLISTIKYLLGLRRWNWRGYMRTQDNYGSCDFAMKVRLDEDEMRKLHDFEEDCMDDLSRKKFISEALKSETQLQTTAEKTEIMYSRLNEMVNEEWNLKSTVWEIESRLESIERNQRDILAMLRAQLTARIGTQGSIEQRRSHLVRGYGPKRRKTRSILHDGIKQEQDAEASSYESQASLPEKQSTFPRRRFRRRNECYTSITDAIKLLMPVRADADLSLETPSAKPSFFLRQNEMLRDYEEASSLITSEIIAGRRRRQSSTWSACEDMHEMDKATGRIGSESSSTDSSESPRHSVYQKPRQC